MTAPEVTFHRASSWGGLASRSRALVPEATVRIDLDREEIWDTHLPMLGVSTGDAAFDEKYFLDGTPAALVRLVVGPSTRRALLAALDLQPSVRIEDGTTTVHNGGWAANDDPSRPDPRHLAVHQALADDHRAVVESWQTTLRDAGAEPGASWPLTGTLPSPVGMLAISISCAKLDDIASFPRSDYAMFTHLRGEHEGRAPWSLRPGRSGDPSAVTLAGRTFVLSGQPPVPLELLAPLIAAADVDALAGGKRLAVTLRNLATADALRSAVQLLALCRGGAASPYR